MTNPMELAGNGTQGWLAIYDTNFSKMNTFVSRFFETKPEGVDTQIKGSGNSSASNALDVKDSDAHLILRIRNDERVGIRVEAPAEALDVAGFLQTDSGLKKGGVQVVGAQQAAIADATVTTTETAGDTYTANEKNAINNLKADVTTLKTQLNLALAALRTHGLIAT